MSKLSIIVAVLYAFIVVLYAFIAYIGHVSNTASDTASDTAWRLGCTSTGMSAADCAALQEKQGD